MKKINNQFDRVSQGYIKVSFEDPIKRYLQYPEALRLIGKVSGKRLLDIGCGNGMCTRMMAKKGADVEAFDPSANLIESARAEEINEILNIRYFVADHPSFSCLEKFDVVTAIMVICAVNYQKMKDIFRDAYASLKSGGRFVVITLNPEFKNFGNIICGRRFTLKDDGNIGIEFFDCDGNFTFDIVDSNFSKVDIEKVSRDVGFNSMSWGKLHVLSEGIKEKGKNFWKDLQGDCPYVGFVAVKK